MTQHRFLALVALIGFGLATSATAVRADRIFFSTAGLPVPIDPSDEESKTRSATPLTPLVVPTIQMNVGEVRTLSIWFLPEGANHAYSSAGWDIDSSAPLVAHLTNHTVANPANINSDNGVRWQGVVQGTQGPQGSADWLTNVRAASVISGTAIGQSTNTNIMTFDQGRDDISRAYYLGDITFQADAPGTTGLYLRTGDIKWIYKGSTTPGQLQYGASTAIHMGNEPGSGDPITPDLAEADAIIQVLGQPIGVSITRTPHDGTNTSGDVIFNGVGFQFQSAGGATSGVINITNYPGDGSGDLPLFFDLVQGANAQQLVDDLNAAAAGAYTAALSSQVLPNASGGGTSTADIVITYAGIAAGTSHLISFDFGAGNGVAAVGIPEPSSLALAGMSLIGLVGYGIRRRRKA